jgi:hypothetical protein
MVDGHLDIVLFASEWVATVGSTKYSRA